MEIVNGYVCKTCCDVDLAKKNINPADPKDDPHNPQSPNYGKTDKPGQPGSALAAQPAVTFGGALAKVEGAASSSDPTASGSMASQPGQPYVPGQLVSLSA